MYMNTWDQQWPGGAGAAGSGAWTLSLTKSTPDNLTKPPGLQVSNTWEALDEPEECENHATCKTWSARQVSRTGTEDESQALTNVSEIFAKYTADFPSTKMDNYSKKSVRNFGERVDKKIWKPMHLFVKETKQKDLTAPKELHPMIEYKTIQDGWVKVKGVMDSGASEGVAPPTMCPHYEIQPSPGSIAGQNYVSASDDLIPNLGEQELDAETADGRSCKVKYQMAEVSRPLNSVSEICDAGGEYGQHVVFGRNGGAIINLETGQHTPFYREDGIYVLEMWVKPNDKSNSGFRRQGD